MLLCTSGSPPIRLLPPHRAPPDCAAGLRPLLAHIAERFLAAPPQPGPYLPEDTLDHRLAVFLATRLSKTDLRRFYELWRQQNFQPWVPNITDADAARALLHTEVRTLFTRGPAGGCSWRGADGISHATAP